MTKFNDLFLTRGVPGTHDTPLLKTFKIFEKKRPSSLLLPKFDKSQDDRLSKKHWKKLKINLTSSFLKVCRCCT